LQNEFLPFLVMRMYSVALRFAMRFP